METNLPAPMTTRVYVNLLEGPGFQEGDMMGQDGDCTTWLKGESPSKTDGEKRGHELSPGRVDVRPS